MARGHPEAASRRAALVGEEEYADGGRAFLLGGLRQNLDTVSFQRVDWT